MASSWGNSWGTSWGNSWGSVSGVSTTTTSVVTPPGGGHGYGHGKRRIYVFPDGTLGYANEAEAYAIAAEMNLHVPATQVHKLPKPVTRKTNAVVARQQLIGFLKTHKANFGPYRKEIARLIKQLRENERKLKELEEEEIVTILTLLH